MFPSSEESYLRRRP